MLKTAHDDPPSPPRSKRRVPFAVAVAARDAHGASRVARGAWRVARPRVRSRCMFLFPGIFVTELPGAPSSPNAQSVVLPRSLVSTHAPSPSRTPVLFRRCACALMFAVAAAVAAVGLQLVLGLDLHRHHAACAPPACRSCAPAAALSVVVLAEGAASPPPLRHPARLPVAGGRAACRPLVALHVHLAVGARRRRPPPRRRRLLPLVLLKVRPRRRLDQRVLRVDAAADARVVASTLACARSSPALPSAPFGGVRMRDRRVLSGGGGRSPHAGNFAFASSPLRLLRLAAQPRRGRRAVARVPQATAFPGPAPRQRRLDARAGLRRRRAPDRTSTLSSGAWPRGTQTSRACPR